MLKIFRSVAPKLYRQRFEIDTVDRVLKGYRTGNDKQIVDEFIKDDGNYDIVLNNDQPPPTDRSVESSIYAPAESYRSVESSSPESEFQEGDKVIFIPWYNSIKKYQVALN